MRKHWGRALRVAILALACGACAHYKTIHGTVKTGDGFPLEGAKVEWSYRGLKGSPVFSDREGHYFGGLWTFGQRRTTHSFRVSRDGFKPLNCPGFPFGNAKDDAGCAGWGFSETTVLLETEGSLRESRVERPEP